MAGSGKDAAPIGLSRVCRVCVGPKGLTLATPHGTELSVGVDALRLLVEIESCVHPSLKDAAAAVTPVQPNSRLLPFAKRLKDAGALTRGHRTEHRARPPVGPATTAPTTPDLDAPLLLATPLILDITPHGFELLDHDGHLIVRMTPAELHALSQFVEAQTIPSALAAHQRATTDDSVSLLRLQEICTSVGGAGLLEAPRPPVPVETATPTSRAQRIGQSRQLRDAVDRDLEAFDRDEAERAARTGTSRIRVVPIHGETGVPLSLGMVMAYARAWKDGALDDRYAFRPDWVAHTRPVTELASEPSVFLFSNYIWSSTNNQRISKQVKDLDPRHITIHGGPEVPNYDHEIEVYFRINPHVDVTIHKEGEITLAEALDALSQTIGSGPPDLSVLRDVPGLSYRGEHGPVRTGDRERLADLDVLPSPYLTGLFDALGEANVESVVIESNRGCPYGCTFCDWGSATLSRIRKFDQQRVADEIEWAARHGVEHLSFADANFGIIERDVEIAAAVADAKARHGYPIHCFTNFAKNTTKHLSEIVAMWSGAGMITAGNLSLQTLDEDTLVAVKRKNIKTAKYDELASEFRSRHLPLAVDLIMGLPGATYEGFKSDLQACVDREVWAKIYPAMLLRNSPMNEPSYRAEHGITLDVTIEEGMANPFAQTVVATSSYTREDYEAMKAMQAAFVRFENFNVLRTFARYVRQEAGVREVDLYDMLRQRVGARPNRWPHIAFTLLMPGVTHPTSWSLFTGDLERFAIDELGIRDDSALRTALEVNRAHLPAPGRRFPVRLELDHDFVAWRTAMLEAKARVGADWPTEAPRLGSFSPGIFVLEDEAALTRTAIAA